MKLLKKERFPPLEHQRGVGTGFVRYVSGDQPTLMKRFSQMEASDTADLFQDMLSHDNGETWSEPRLQLQSEAVEGGRWRYAANSAIYLPGIDRLLSLGNYGFYPNGLHSVNSVRWQLMLSSYNAARDAWQHDEPSDYGFANGIMSSFSFPIELSSGRVLFPAQTPAIEPDGKDMHLPGYGHRVLRAAVLMLDDPAADDFTLRVGGVVELDTNRSSRGMFEPTLAELSDGRIAMVARGDNGYFREKPGCKWVCFSQDGGESWSHPNPLMGDDHRLYESSSTGSVLVRSIKNGRLYWIGNLMPWGRRARGNHPRHPLVIVEVVESPFQLKMDSLTVIDDRQPNEPEHVQMSNFCHYQDRQTGDLVLFLTRVGEKGDDTPFDAGHYRYRVSLDEG